MANVLTINEELFIGSGGHQATYIHPLDATKCIKIPHAQDDGDVRKEMRYRRICAGKLERSRLVTQFFGTVETNLGLGYVFERVLDYNGKTSLDMKKFLPTTRPDSATLQRIWTILFNFKSDFLSENIAIVDTDIENFMVQESKPGVYRVRIVDNIGTPVLIPLVYWFDFAAAWKAKRYWNKIVAWLAENYSEIIPPELAAQLKAD
ncbi:MAG: hypothetical protein J5497_06675 [Selenomonadaceae bacterium]|nr:hypothetical protein [Selenomonadaceae bacterium]